MNPTQGLVNRLAKIQADQEIFIEEALDFHTAFKIGLSRLNRSGRDWIITSLLDPFQYFSMIVFTWMLIVGYGWLTRRCFCRIFGLDMSLKLLICLPYPITIFVLFIVVCCDLRHLRAFHTRPEPPAVAQSLISVLQVLLPYFIGVFTNADPVMNAAVLGDGYLQGVFEAPVQRFNLYRRNEPEVVVWPEPDNPQAAKVMAMETGSLPRSHDKDVHSNPDLVDVERNDGASDSSKYTTADVDSKGGDLEKEPASLDFNAKLVLKREEAYGRNEVFASDAEVGITNFSGTSLDVKAREPTDPSISVNLKYSDETQLGDSLNWSSAIRRMRDRLAANCEPNGAVPKKLAGIGNNRRRHSTSIDSQKVKKSTSFKPDIPIYNGTNGARRFPGLRRLAGLQNLSSGSEPITVYGSTDVTPGQGGDVVNNSKASVPPF